MKLVKDRLKHLDQVALDVEFLLISVIQGVALVKLVEAATDPIVNLEFHSWPYIVTAFLFVLIFWSGAIVHAVTFIQWPINLIHSFLYFLASFIEILTIANLAHPLIWFLCMLLFQFVALFLYTYDLRLMKQHKKKHEKLPESARLYEMLISEQTRELKIYIPFSLGFNATALVVLLLYKTVFIIGSYHLLFISLQLLFALIFLYHKLQSFEKISKLILEV
jgi:hypothetical protein